MAALFVAASNQYLSNATAPITAAPFTVAFWFRMPTSGSYQILWALTDTSGVANDFYVAKETGNTMSWNGDQGGSFFAAIAGTAITTNAWTFVVAREISATNHRISVLHATGAITHAQDTTSITPAGVDAVQIGAIANPTVASPMDGHIAEFALWNVDVQKDGGQLQNSTLRQMAYGGPFSMRHVLGNLVNYKSLKSTLITTNSKPNEDYTGAGLLRQVWTNVNGVTLGEHVPLAGTYPAPSNYRQYGMI